MFYWAFKNLTFSYVPTYAFVWTDLSNFRLLHILFEIKFVIPMGITCTFCKWFREMNKNNSYIRFILRWAITISRKAY